MGPVLLLLSACATGPVAPAPGGSPAEAVPAEAVPAEAVPAAAPVEAAPAVPAAPAAPAAEAPPRGLACLARWYGGTPARRETGWVLRLPDGAERPWDDGRAKTFDEALAAPDLQDTLSIPYVPGPIVPVTVVDHDPGRIRDDALFAALHGSSAAEVEAALVSVDFVGQPLRVHPRAAEPLRRVSARLAAALTADASLAPFVTGPLGGTFAWRPIVNTTRRSVHSYGLAIDVATARSDYWEWAKTGDGAVRWTNRVPQAVVDAFEAEGFAWGGRWYHYDTMHFEYRPELFDPDCRP